MKFRTQVGFVFAAVLACFALPIFAVEGPSKRLLDLSSSQVDPHLSPKCDQVTFAPSTDASAPGIVVTIQPGAEAYPGVILKPEADSTFDLSAFGHVESRVTNLGSSPLNLILQAENAGDWHDAPWNAEQVAIKPGAKATLSVTFGYTYGHRPGYPLKSSAVSRVLLFTGKSDAVRSFRIESLIAAGAAGEKPPIDPASVRIKPKDGIVVGPGATFDAFKQIETKGATKASMDGQALAVEFATGKGEQSISLKPPVGRWDFGNASQVRVKIKNTGTSPAIPAIQLTSEKVNGSDLISASVPIAPGDSEEIVVPFASAVPWEGVPSASIWKGELSGEKTGSADVKPGTGTRYASDRTDAIKITSVHNSPATLSIESIVAEAPVGERPEWLGKRPPVDGEWTQTFDDEFTATQIDQTKWNNVGPNYWDKISHWSKDNVILDGQNVHLHYEQKVGFQNDDPSQKQTNYACGYLDTLGKWRQRYGYFEARVKLPNAPGLWPAFWMMPDRGESTPDAPGSKKNRCTTSNGGMEFDIMEHLTVWGPRRYNIAMHWDDYGPKHKSIGTGKIYFQPDADGFVTTGLLWAPGLAVYYCNGKEVARWEDSRVSNVPSYLIFTMPAGGWDGNTLDASSLPDDLVVDYVRVWQRKDLIAPSTEPAAPSTMPQASK